MADDPRVLIYTVSRADTPARVDRALASLHTAQSTTGTPHEWILWANAPGIHSAAKLMWQNGQLWNDGTNTGQHVALGEILRYARAEHFDFIVKVDDDLTWLTKRWLSKLLNIEEACHRFSNRRVVLGARVLGLRNQIPVAAKIKLGRIPLLVVPIVGGACRLHHISFFDEYVPDVRRAMGAGGDTSIAQHAKKIQVGMFLVPWVRVEHKTDEMEAADPAYFSHHAMFQAIPYVPRWSPHG